MRLPASGRAAQQNPPRELRSGLSILFSIVDKIYYVLHLALVFVDAYHVLEPNLVNSLLLFYGVAWNEGFDFVSVEIKHGEKHDVY